MKTAFVLATFAFFTSAGFSRGAVLAGPVTNPANGHFYYLLSPATWTASESEAVRLGGHLISIKDAEEDKWAYDTFASHEGIPRALWIGFNDRDAESQFTWVSGETVIYTNWNTGEPNNLDGDQDFTHIYPPNDLSGRARRWNDIPDIASAEVGGALFEYHGVVEVSRTVAESTFDTTIEEWNYQKEKVVLAPDVFALRSNGNPGGCLFVDEYGSGDGDITWFSAPSQFLGDRSACYGGHLQYDLRLTIASDSWDYEHVQLWSDQEVFVFQPTHEPLTTWTHFEIPLRAESWHVASRTGANPTAQQFRAALANVTRFLIRAEYIDASPYDNCYLDNVRLVAAHSPLMTIGASGSDAATLEWPTSAVGFFLETTDNLMSGQWTRNVPVISTNTSNGWNQAIVRTIAVPSFYRLAKP